MPARWASFINKSCPFAMLSSNPRDPEGKRGVRIFCHALKERVEYRKNHGLTPDPTVDDLEGLCICRCRDKQLDCKVKKEYHTTKVPFFQKSPEELYGPSV